MEHAFHDIPIFSHQNVLFVETSKFTLSIPEIAVINIFTFIFFMFYLNFIKRKSSFFCVVILSFLVDIF